MRRPVAKNPPAKTSPRVRVRNREGLEIRRVHALRQGPPVLVVELVLEPAPSVREVHHVRRRVCQQKRQRAGEERYVRSYVRVEGVVKGRHRGDHPEHLHHLGPGQVRVEDGVHGAQLLLKVLRHERQHRAASVRVIGVQQRDPATLISHGARTPSSSVSTRMHSSPARSPPRGAAGSRRCSCPSRRTGGGTGRGGAGWRTSPTARRNARRWIATPHPTAKSTRPRRSR